MPSFLPPALEVWLRDPSHEEVEAKWVPGLNTAERKALAAVGGVAMGVLGAARLLTLPSDVRSWMDAAPTPPFEAQREFRRMLQADPDLALASLYSAIVRREHRRQLGTFFTPSAEVKLMLDLWSDTEETVPTTVIDVGAGVGVFTAEAAKKWPESVVVAVDINPITLGLLAVRLFSDGAMPNDPNFTRRVELVRDDFTRWFVSDAAPKQGGRLILGNPPYTRAQLMSTSERVRLHELTGGLCGTRASLSTTITALTLQHLGPTDGLSLLLPAQWLESQYARALRKEMWAMNRRRIELRLVESEDLFGGAQVDAVALLVGAQRDKPQPFGVAKWRESLRTELDRAESPPESWRAFFEAAPAPAPSITQRAPVPLSEIADVHRGVATGANATFVLSAEEARWLPKESVTRVITRLFDLPQDLDDPALEAASDRSVGWLLAMTEKQVNGSKRLTKLVKAAEETGVQDRLLCSRRATWYDLRAEVRRPDVVIGAMTQSRFKLVTNSVRATITNNLYGISWKSNVDEAQRKAVIEWLRSKTGQAALTTVARRQGAGLLKLEPGGLRTLPVPARVVGRLHSTAEGSPDSNAIDGRLTSASVQRPLPSSGK